jgi:hypothetical protein
VYVPAGITTPSGNADTTDEGDVLENVTTAPLGGAGEIAPDTVTDCPSVIDAGATPALIEDGVVPIIVIVHVTDVAVVPSMSPSFGVTIQYH